MADFAYSQSEMDAAEELNSGTIQKLINFTGGLVSIVLIAGMVAWGWQLMVRDVSGVPVVEALEGPMRIEPADPGGSQADHQGLSVNRIAEGQEAAPAADRIVLAPPPVELAEIAPQAEPAPVAPLVSDGSADAATDGAVETGQGEIGLVAAADSAEAALPVATAEGPPTPEAAAEATLALIDQLLTEEAPAPDQDVAQEATVAAEVASSIQFSSIQSIPISVAGLRQSVLPTPRPSALELAAAELAGVTEAAADGTPAQPEEIDPEGLPRGTRLVQLGAFDAMDEARAEWDRLALAYPDFFDARSRIVQEATSGGRDFVRLRAHGFADLMDARRFCTALLAEGAPCIPVTVR
ncbi:MAG: SPOR domain-containing protein [Pseudomonadota bacterium]